MFNVKVQVFSEGFRTFDSKKGSLVAMQPVMVTTSLEAEPYRDELFIPVRDGKAIPHKVGSYSASARLESSRFGMLIKIDDRSLIPSQLSSVSSSKVA